MITRRRKLFIILLPLLISACSSSAISSSSITDTSSILSTSDDSSSIPSSSDSSSSSISDSSSSSSSSSSTSGTSSSGSSSSESSSTVDVSIYQLNNGDFETGALDGWTVVSGTAFSNTSLSSLTNVNVSVSYNKQGVYFLKSNENSEGILKSSSFIVGGSGYVTFKFGAAYMQALTYLSFIDAQNEIEIYRVGNERYNAPSSGYINYRVENMSDYYINLSAYQGREIYLQIIDQSVSNYGYVTVDAINTYHQDIPSLLNLTEASNIRPIFTDLASTPTNLYNGNFASRTLAGYTVVGEAGVFQASHINSSLRLSNRPDETKIGVLRSSSFKVSGTNLMSVRLGATKHKAVTYMSVKRVGTNEEVFRTYSDRWKDIHEENTHLYYLDLTNYRDQALYLEFVDNSRGDWGLLSIEAIQTYYATYPQVHDELAYNLFDAVNTTPTYQAMRDYINPYIASISDSTTKTTLTKTFYATLDGISNRIGNWPSVVNYYPTGNNFIITGDINAMWLRDSSAQVLPYLQFMTLDTDVRLLVKGLLRQQFEQIRRDPYANAFNPDGSVFERKFEIDSLMYPLWLAYEYYSITADGSIFDAFFRMTLNQVLDTLDDERHHSDDNYRIENTTDRDAGPHDVNLDSGLIWSGYRPSDDVTYYKYFIPGNMFAVATLEKMNVLLNTLDRFSDLAERAELMATQVRAAIETYGVYNHPKYGKMYAFEVNGMTSDPNSSTGKLLMDAANIPSLLAIPWLGYAPIDDITYQNTRSFILSFDNPYYYEGTYAKGIGDPHDQIGGPNPNLDVPVPWHMALAMQGLTTTDEDEMALMIEYMTNTTDGTYVMHEAFNANNPAEYSRDWFTWPCALYAHLYITKILNINLV